MQQITWGKKCKFCRERYRTIRKPYLFKQSGGRDQEKEPETTEKEAIVINKT